MIDAHRGTKRGRVMARAASLGALNMGRGFTDRQRAVMAGAARSHHLGVVDANGRIERGRAVARFAYRGRRNMHGRFADRVGAVMTTCTVIRDARMVERRVGETRRVMAGVALSRGRNMVGGFAYGERSVMTGAA